ncbi:hypothetical protein C8F01DRAFT_6752 [Mycena amicta]|nr:hypothetical protein C8F01DRAFT_6752 [Mycena amicta]
MSGSAPTPATRAADRARLSALDAEIEPLKISLDALYAERKIVEDRLAAYTYPVLTLPNEIVSEIFIQYIPTYPACPPLLGDGSPTKLAQICRIWREIAHATPALWRSITLFSSASFPDVTELQLVTAQTWLERSSALPLSIWMGSQAHSGRLHDKALDHFLAHRARWEYATLLIPDNSPSNHAICLEGSMPILLELDLRFDSVSRLGTLIGSLEAPRLSTAFLDCCVLEHVELLPTLLPWSQLTKLLLHYVTPETAAMILCETPNLVHCRLEFVTGDASGIRILSLPRLEILIIRSDLSSSAEIYDFLLAFRAPALKGLHIDEDMLGLQDGLSPLPTAVKSLECKLERLRIVNSLESSLEDYRSMFPEIVHLELGDDVESAEVWGHWGDLDGPE